MRAEEAEQRARIIRDLLDRLSGLRERTVSAGD